MTGNTNSQLKDFQKATVEYVFNRFFNPVNPGNRFLVADEVGLGKTLVARGVIQKFYDHFKKLNKKELNVIYICSNQSIASQNISRLNIEKQKGVAQAQISRINDLAITNMDQNSNSFLRIVALSPNTSFNISSGGGQVKERAMLYHILSQHENFSIYKPKLKKLFRLDVGEYNWGGWVASNSWIKQQLREEIVFEFNEILNQEHPLFQILLSICEDRFNVNEQPSHRRIIGGLRKLLASVCVKRLKPDLIILDEFQRFKYLINEDEDNDVRLITESLFNDTKIRILLLSATPYKMFTLQSEEDDGESHFEEFKFVVEFLFNNKDRKDEFLIAWEDYSKSLLHLKEGKLEYIKTQKDRVEGFLRDIIARTERITVSDDRNTLLRSSKSSVLWITPSDIQNFISVDSVAAKLKDVNSPVEYCKSSPFPFSFMEGYQLQRLTQKEILLGNEIIKSALKKSKDSFVPIELMNDYNELNNTNAKLKYLLDDILYQGGNDLLWIPPSLPYYQFFGPFEGMRTFSKVLVFSSWVMVPKMIAALSSYECERTTIGDMKAISNADDRSDRKYFHTGSERHPKPRLRFRIENNNYSTLSQYALLYPCVTLSDLWKASVDEQTMPELIETLAARIQALILDISTSTYITDPSKKDDDRWALIYMLLLDRKLKNHKLKDFRNSESLVDWSWFYAGEEGSVSNQYYEKVFKEILFSQGTEDVSASLLRLRSSLSISNDSLRSILSELRLGQPPSDIATQLAYLAIASPAICTYRLLSSYTAANKQLDYVSFFGAFRVADSFRKFFNVSENIAVIDKHSLFDSYWKNVTWYNATGNFQSMIDEFANILIDYNGLWEYSLEDKINKLVVLISNNIGLRTVSVTAHTYDSFIKESRSKHFRCHFGVALNQSIENEKDVVRGDSVRASFNSPFRPFVLATTSIGQEGLDFHLYCRKILHWNLPSNPVDFEQREGRINRFKNLAIRQNLAIKYRDKLQSINAAQVWDELYDWAVKIEKGDKSDLVPYWHVEPTNIFIERQVPIIPYSKEVRKLKNLLKTISVYRIALGQPRQEELVNYLLENLSEEDIKKVQLELLINLSPYNNSRFEEQNQTIPNLPHHSTITPQSLPNESSYLPADSATNLIITASEKTGTTRNNLE
jgi:hypothetical protein